MTDDVKAILAAYKCGSDADLLHKFIDAATCFIPKGAALGALVRLVAGHRAEVERLTKERDNWKAHAVSRGKRLRQARDKFINICDGIEDEIDRVYFGSSNDAEAFKDEVAWLDEFAWDKIMGEPDDWDLLGALEKQKDRATAAEKSRDEAIAELNKALETLGQLRSDLQRVKEERDEALDQVRRKTLLAKENERIARDAAKQADEAGARAQSAEASLAKLREAALFLSDRISDFNPDDDNPAREFYGHVNPAAARLRSLLDEPDKDQNNAKR